MLDERVRGETRRRRRPRSWRPPRSSAVRSIWRTSPPSSRVFLAHLEQRHRRRDRVERRGVPVSARRLHAQNVHRDEIFDDAAARRWPTRPTPPPSAVVVNTMVLTARRAPSPTPRKTTETEEISSTDDEVDEDAQRTHRARRHTPARRRATRASSADVSRVLASRFRTTRAARAAKCFPRAHDDRAGVSRLTTARAKRGSPATSPPGLPRDS